MDLRNSKKSLPLPGPFLQPGAWTSATCRRWDGLFRDATLKTTEPTSDGSESAGIWPSLQAAGCSVRRHGSCRFCSARLIQKMKRDSSYSSIGMALQLLADRADNFGHVLRDRVGLLARAWVFFSSKKKCVLHLHALAPDMARQDAARAQPRKGREIGKEYRDGHRGVAETLGSSLWKHADLLQHAGGSRSTRQSSLSSVRIPSPFSIACIVR